MAAFEPNPAAVDFVFNAQEVPVQELIDMKQDSNERFSVRGEIVEVRMKTVKEITQTKLFKKILLLFPNHLSHMYFQHNPSSV